MVVLGAALCAFIATFLLITLPLPCNRRLSPVYYSIGVGLILLVHLGRYFPSLITLAPFRLFSFIHSSVIVTGIAAILIIVPCLWLLPKPRARVLLVVFLALCLLRASMLPLASAVASRAEIELLETRLDGDGVCRQTTTYTCGPAATVTLLKAMGIEETVRNVALATKCNAYAGTRSGDIVNYINEHYADAGLRAAYVYAPTLDALERLGEFSILEVRASPLVDHYVVLLGFDDQGRPIVGDPSLGKFHASPEALGKVWRKRAIVVTREST